MPDNKITSTTLRNQTPTLDRGGDDNPTIPTRNISPIEGVKKDIIKQYTVEDAGNYIRKKQQINSFFFQPDNKIDMTSTASFDDMYIGIGDEYIGKYDTYLKGVDNYQRNALLQTDDSKWENGLKKAGVKLLTTAAGTTIGSVTSAINWMSNGFETEALYTDDFNTWLGTVNQKLSYKLPNYYSAQEKQEGFFGSFDEVNFWANDVAGGIAFTLGAIVGEAIWATVTGGASLSTTAVRMAPRMFRTAKMAKTAAGIGRWSELGKTMVRKGFTTAKTARRVGRVGETLNTARFMYTSAGYEAGVEARQLMLSATKNFEQTIQRQHGRTPTAEERKAFEERLTTAANSAYIANGVLVSAANLAIFGKMFNITNPLTRAGSTLTKGFNKKVFGIGTKVSTEGGKLTRTLLKPSVGQKVLGYSTSIAKAPFIEGVWEEGQQSVIHNTAENWLDSGYNMEATQNSYGLMEAMYDGYAHTYGTKEGWKEIGIGMIVGLVGGGVSGQFSSYSNALKSEKQYAEAINDNHVGTAMLTDRMFAANQIYKANKDQVEAEKRGDFVGEQNARKRAIFSSLRVHERHGRMDEAYEDFKTSIELIDAEKIAEENNISVEEVEEYKEAVVAEYKETQDMYADAVQYGRYIVGTGDTTKDLEGLDIKGTEKEAVNKEWVAEAIAYNIVMGKGATESADLILEQIKQGLGTIVTSETKGEFEKAMRVRDVLAKTTAKKRNRLSGLKGERTKLIKQEQDLKDEVKESQKVLARIDNQEEKARISANLIELASKLEKTNEKIVAADKAYELAFQTLELENNAQTIGDKISAEDLDKVAEVKGGKIVGGTLFEIDQTLESLSETNPQKYEEFKKLFHEYEKAIYSLKEFNKTFEGIAREDFSPANFNTKLEKIIGKKKSASDFTREFFANVGNQMWLNFTEEQLGLQDEGTQDEKTNTKAKEGDDIDEDEGVVLTDEDFNKFVDTGEVSNDILNNIAEKVKNNAELTKQELAIYQNKSKEVEDIVKENTPSATEKLKSLIKKALEENSLISEYIGDDYTSAQANQPTEKEVERYRELHNKIEKGNLSKSVLQSEDPETIIKQMGSQTTFTKEEIEEFQRLNNKLSNWQVTEGVMTDGNNSTLAILIERLQQLQTKPETNNTKETVTNKDAIQIEKASDKNSSMTRDSKEMIQTPQGVYMSVDRGTYSISHMTVVDLWLKLGGKAEIFYKKGKELKEADLDTIEKIQKEEGTTFVFKQDGLEIEFGIGQKSRIEFAKSEWKKIEDALTVKFLTAEGVDPSSQSYILGYEITDNGISPATSSFEINTSRENTLPKMTEEEMQAVEKVKAVVDPENSYNKKLLAKVKRAKTDKAKKETEEALENGVVVYLVNGNKIVGILRGGGMQDLGKGESSINYGLIRNRAVQNLKAGETTDLINLNVTVPIEFKYSGSPIFRLKLEGEKLVLDSKAVTAEDLKLITDAGYVKNGKLTTKKGTEKVNTIYLPKTTEKTPVVIFKHRGENIAFPVSLSQNKVDITYQLQEILNFQHITDGEKINRINKFLLENGIAPSDYNLEERDLRYTNKLEIIAERLSDYTTVPSVEAWTQKSFDLNRLKNEALIAIDITDHPFNTPKLKMDLGEASFRKVTLKNTESELIDAEVEAVNELYDSIMSLGTPHNAPESFGELWDDISEKGDTGNYMKDRHPNRKTMIKFSKKFGTKYAKETYTTEEIEQVQNLGKRAEKAIEATNAVRNKIRINKELKEEAEQQRKKACK